MLFILFFSCGKVMGPSDLENTPENNFDIFWRDFDRHYAFFEYKQINWDSLYTVYRKQVTPERWPAGTEDDFLTGILPSLIMNLEDRHVSLYTHKKAYYSRTNPYKWIENYKPSYFDIDIPRIYYLEKNVKYAGEKRIMYGKLNSECGYIYIGDFDGDTNWSHEIEEVLGEFRNLKSIILDVRDNFGGKLSNAMYIASRFADKKRLYAYEKWRNGPKHNDFTEPVPLYVEPSKKWRFTKPVVLLADRRTFSAAESFVLAMRTLPNVTVIGNHTTGGGGTPLYRELPNGWVYQMSISAKLTPEKDFFEGKGLSPDINVVNTSEAMNSGRDLILEKAIQLLSGNEIN